MGLSARSLKWNKVPFMRKAFLDSGAIGGDRTMADD